MSYNSLLLGLAAWHDFCVKWLLRLCKLLVNCNFDLEPDYVYFFGRTINRLFQQYIVCTEILSTFHARVKYIYVKKYTIQTNGNEKPPLPLGGHGPHLIHSSLDRPHSPPQTASRSNQPCCHSTSYGPTNWQTDWDRLTDRIDDKSVRRALTLYWQSWSHWLQHHCWSSTYP